MERGGYTYIMTNNAKKPLYIGVTSNLAERTWQHKTNHFKGSFTTIYNLHKLVYYEDFDSIAEAISREKQLKRWHRNWKLNLIESTNSDFKDLYDYIKDNCT